MNDTASSRKEIISTDSQRLAAENQILRLKNKSQKLQLDALQLELESLRKENTLLLTENQVLKDRDKNLKADSADPEYKSQNRDNKTRPTEVISERKDNATEGKDNKTGSLDNLADSQANKSDSQDNKSGEGDNKSEGENNKSDVGHNKSDWQDNKSDVGHNKSDWQDNKSDWQNNKSDWQDNKSGWEDNITEVEHVWTESLKGEKFQKNDKNTPEDVKVIKPGVSAASLPSKNPAIIDLDFVLTKVFRRNKNEFGVYNGACSANNYLNSDKQSAARFLLALNNLYPFYTTDVNRNKLIHIAVFQAIHKKMESKRPSILVPLRRAGILLFTYQHQNFTCSQLKRTFRISDTTVCRHISFLRSMSFIGARYSKREGNIFFLNQEGKTFMDSILKSIES